MSLKTKFPKLQILDLFKALCFDITKIKGKYRFNKYKSVFFLMFDYNQQNKLWPALQCDKKKATKRVQKVIMTVKLEYWSWGSRWYLFF